MSSPTDGPNTPKPDPFDGWDLWQPGDTPNLINLDSPKDNDSLDFPAPPSQVGSDGSDGEGSGSGIGDIADLILPLVGSQEGSDSEIEDPVVLAEKTAAVTKIQALARGMIARRRYHRLQVELVGNFFHQQLDRHYETLVSAQKQTQESYDAHALLPTDREHNIEQIEHALELLRAVRSQLIDELDDPDVVDTSAMKLRYVQLLQEVDMRCYVVAASTGLGSMEELLESFYGDSWQDRVTGAAQERIKELSPLFSPMGGRSIEMEVQELGRSVFYKSDEEEDRIFDLTGDASLGLPVVQEVNFFTTPTVVESLDAAEVVIPVDGGQRAFVIKGRFRDDPAHVATSAGWFGRKRDTLAEVAEEVDLPPTFKKRFLERMRLSQMATVTPGAFPEMLRDAHRKMLGYRRTMPHMLMGQFMSAPFSQMVEMVDLLLLDDEGRKRAALIYNLLSEQLPGLETVFLQNLSYDGQQDLGLARDELEELLSQRRSTQDEVKSPRQQINELKLNELVPQEVIDKLEEKLAGSGGMGGDGGKNKTWLERALRLPFGQLVPDLASPDSSDEEIRQVLGNLRKVLNEGVVGHDEAKELVVQMVAQWANSDGSDGEVFALQGPPGNGKTTFAFMLAEALGRPVVKIPLGGATDGHTLKGHSETYVGSRMGQIAEGLMKAQAMNAIVIFDEIDKISKTAGGDELIGILTHFFDSSQNNEFHDDYFAGLPIDCSKLLIIATFNDRKKVEGIMGDRITVIETDGLSLHNKKEVCHRHLMPGILREAGFDSDDVTIDDEAIQFIVEGYTFEAGARKFKEKLKKIVRTLLVRQKENPTEFSPPYHIDVDLAREVLGRPKEMITRVASEPQVGVVNSLFRAASSIGGISPIQVGLSPSYQWGGSRFTGKVNPNGEEPLDVTETVMWDLLPEEVMDSVQERPAKSFHIFRKVSIDDDIAGGDMGAAVVLAMLSKVMNAPARSDVAITGGVDMEGNLTKTDGLYTMLEGARRAGVRKVIVPKVNREELMEIQKRDPNFFKDPNFKVVLCSNVKQAVKHCIDIKAAMAAFKEEAADQRRKDERDGNDHTEPRIHMGRRRHGRRGVPGRFGH